MFLLSTWYRDFLEDLRALIHSGVPLRDALESMAAQKRGSLAGRLAEKIREGSTLAEAMESCALHVPAVHVALVAVGERTGSLERILGELVKILDDQRASRLEFLQSMAWPVLLLVAAVVLLPLYLFVTGEAGTYLLIQAVFFLPVLVIGGLWVWCVRFAGAGSGLGAFFERAVFKLPWIRSLALEANLSRVFSALAILLEVGGSLEEAIELAAGTVRYEKYRGALLSLRGLLRGGKRLWEAFRDTPELLLKPAWIARIQTGEMAGSLDRSFRELGLDLKERVRLRVKKVLRVLPAIVILLVGAFVLSRALGVLSSFQAIHQ